MKTSCILIAFALMTVAFPFAKGGEANAELATAESISKIIRTCTAHERDLANARYELKSRRLRVLTDLHSEGHANFLELVRARIGNASALANLNSLNSLSRFSTQKMQSANSRSKGSPSIASILVRIPGMQNETSLRALGYIALPYQAGLDLEFVDSASSVSGMENEGDDLIKPSEAWAKLEEKLESLSSASSNQELLHVRLKKAEASANEEVIESRSSVIQFLSDKPTEVQQALSEYFSIKLESELSHELQFANYAHDQMNEVHARVVKAAEKHAVRDSELAQSEHRVAASLNRSQVAKKLVESISNERDSLSSRKRRFVSKNTEHVLFNISQSTRTQLEIASEKALRALVEVAQETQFSQSEMQRSLRLVNKLSKLADSEPYFENELTRARLLSDIATAQHAANRIRHQQAVLVHEYVNQLFNASSGGDSVKAWIDTLTELLEIHSKSTDQEMLAESNIQYAKWRLTGLNKLHQSGSATWKELTEARVQLGEFVQDKVRFRRQRLECKLAKKLLDDFVAEFRSS